MLDFFAGSGTTGIAAYELDRRFILIDNNELALQAMAARFAGLSGIDFEDFNPIPYQANT